MALFEKIAGTSATTFQLGIGAVAAMVKWTASKVTLRNKADTNYVGLAAQTVDLYDTAGTRKVTLALATGAAADTTINFPPDAGTAGYVLRTDGATNTTWVAAGSTVQCASIDTTTLAFGTASPQALFTLPANAIVTEVSVIVDTAFAGGTGATVSVGVSGTASKYVGTGDIDLATASEYLVRPGLASVGTTEALIATYSAGGATAGSARILVTFSIPT